MASEALVKERVATSRQAPRWWFAPVLLVVIATLGYALAEGLVAAGLLDFRVILGTLGDEPWRNPMNRLDPDLLHIHRPHQHIAGQMQGGDIAYYLRVRETHSYSYDVRTDRDGFRNDQDLDQADLAVVGDSYVEGILVPAAQTLPMELGRQLGLSAVNLGQIWYGPQQEEIVLRRYALTRQPKIVVWCYFEGNDLRDMARYDANHSQWEVIAPKLHSFKQRSLARNAALLLLRLEGAQKQRPLGERNVGLLPDGQRMYFFYRNDTVTHQEREYRPKFQEVVRRAFEACDRQGVRMVFAYVPIKARVYGDLVTFPADSVFRNAFSATAVDEMRGLVAEVSDKILFVDLTTSLQETSRQELTYFLDDTHWTAAGHRAAASAIARALRDSSAQP